MKVEMNLPDLPDGYEYTGEYRRAHEGEDIMRNTGCLGTYYGELESSCLHLIVRKKRWRAIKEGTYYTMDSDFDVFNSSEEGTIIDDERYQIGNYFQTREEAEEASIKIKQLLKELHNNGSK